MPETCSRITTLLEALIASTPESISSVSELLFSHLQAPCIESLVHILFTHPLAPVRTLAATLLRQHQIKYFHEVSPDTLATTAKKILERLHSEPHPHTRRAIIDLAKKLPITDEELLFHFLPVTAALLSSPDRSLRSQAFLAFGVTTETFKIGLHGRDVHVRRAAMIAYCEATLRPNSSHIQLLPMSLEIARSTPVDDEAFPHIHELFYEALTNLYVLEEFSPHLPDAFRHALLGR